MANKQTLFCGTNKMYISEDLIKEANEANSGVAFRIPSLINADGTLIAAIDKAYTGMDWGYIELAVRTSEDNGKTWSNINTVATPPARIINSDGDNTATAFFIDPCMVVAPNGDVIMLATYFPESKGIFNKKMLDKNKVAYSTFNGKTVPLIYDRYGNHYYVLDNGTVLDNKKVVTNYKLNFADGELFKNEEYIGNIFLNGAIGKSDNENNKTTYGAPLKAVRRSYIFMLKSSDKGKTWSKPVDITGSILNYSTDGLFMGIAPGNAITTSTGRIVVPCYTLKGSVCIYSDDNGETWRRNKNATFTPNIDEWTLVETPNKDIISFSRAKMYGKTPMAISKDNALNWQKIKNAPIKAPKCQKNAIVIDDKILLSHPSEKKRQNGVISVGTFKYNKHGEFKGIKWNKEDIEINNGFFAYSCMAKIDENTVGILYEDQPSSHIVFETFNI